MEEIPDEFSIASAISSIEGYLIHMYIAKDGPLTYKDLANRLHQVFDKTVASDLKLQIENMKNAWLVSEKNEPKENEIYYRGTFLNSYIYQELNRYFEIKTIEEIEIISAIFEMLLNEDLKSIIETISSKQNGMNISKLQSSIRHNEHMSNYIDELCKANVIMIENSLIMHGKQLDKIVVILSILRSALIKLRNHYCDTTSLKVDPANTLTIDTERSTFISTQPSSSNRQKILIAEDEQDIALLYKVALEKRNHKVTITKDGEECLKIYQEESQRTRFDVTNKQMGAFDAIILDYKMPRIDGMEVAKEILSVNPHQRIIFASAYVKEVLLDSIKNLNQIVELMQKPFAVESLVNSVEDKEVYSELQKFGVDIDMMKSANPTHDQILDLLERVRKFKSS